MREKVLKVALLWFLSVVIKIQKNKKWLNFWKLEHSRQLVCNRT